MVRRLVGVGEIDGAPLDIENTVGRTAGHRREDTHVPPGKAAQSGLASVR